MMIQLLIREYHIYIVSAKMNIKRIRQLARELNINMINHGIHCLPRDIRKYTGTIGRVNRADGIVAWVVKVRYLGFYCNATFYNEAEAFAHLQKINMKEELDIKNRFTVFEDKVVALLPNGDFTCDTGDIDIVEDHLWSANAREYVTAQINGAKCSFHNLVMNNMIGPDILILKFIDKNHLNCCKSNLCLVDKRAINITCPMQKNNTWGTVGVHASWKLEHNMER